MGSLLKDYWALDKEFDPGSYRSFYKSGGSMLGTPDPWKLPYLKLQPTWVQHNGLPALGVAGLRGNAGFKTRLLSGILFGLLGSY